MRTRNPATAVYGYVQLQMKTSELLHRMVSAVLKLFVYVNPAAGLCLLPWTCCLNKPGIR